MNVVGAASVTPCHSQISIAILYDSRYSIWVEQLNYLCENYGRKIIYLWDMYSMVNSICNSLMHTVMDMFSPERLTQKF